MRDRNYRRGSLVWPVVLIGAGIIFMLNNLGRLDWTIWDTLLRLWPVLLIAVGLEILLGRRSIWGLAAVAFFLLAVLVGAIIMGGVAPAQGEMLTGETVQQALQGATEAKVDIAFGAGELWLDALPEDADLIQGTVARTGREEIVTEYFVSGDIGQYTLRSRNGWAVPAFGLWRNDRRWDLGLNRDIPIDLRLDAGVGASILDLSELNLAALDIDCGIGRVQITLPRRGGYRGKIDTGIGEVRITLPRGAAARIEVDTGIGDVRVRGDLQRRGDVYYSADYEGATSQIDLKVDGGIGSIILIAE